jgi:hypothetical protein
MRRQYIETRTCFFLRHCRESSNKQDNIEINFWSPIEEQFQFNKEH